MNRFYHSAVSINDCNIIAGTVQRFLTVVSDHKREKTVGNWKFLNLKSQIFNL